MGKGRVVLMFNIIQVGDSDHDRTRYLVNISVSKDSEAFFGKGCTEVR